MSEPLPPAENANLRAGLPLEPAPATGEPIAYRPISGWAIASVIVGGLFAVLVALSTSVAFWQGAPMFLPVWIVSLAVVGGVLALLGQRHVQNSEGTRAGAKLARIGLWLSLVSGLGYLSYYFVTGLAVQNQAYAFLMEKTDDDSGFLPRLVEGGTDPVQLNAAFLLTRPPRRREHVKPDNETEMLIHFDANKEGMPGDLAAFKYGMAPQTILSALPRILFKDNAKQAKIIDQGVQEWKYEQKSFTILRKFRIESKEVEWVVTLAVTSSEAEAAGQGRRWYVNLPASGFNQSTLTPFGEGMRLLRWQSRDKLLADLRSDKGMPKLKEIDGTEWNKRFGDDFPAKRAFLHQLFADTNVKRFEPFQFWANGQEAGRWEDVGGKLRIYHSFRFGMPRALGQPAAYSVDAYAVLEADRVIDPATYGPSTVPPQWDLVRIVFTNIGPIVEKKGMSMP